MDADLIKILSGSEFQQIYFLDEFPQEWTAGLSSKDLGKLFSELISKGKNLYIKRTAFKILCILTITDKIQNRYIALGFAREFLEQDVILQAIALRYLVYFEESKDAGLSNKIKELSDSDNAEVASQAYFLLGILSLRSILAKDDPISSIQNLQKCSAFFQAAYNCVENRVDADFFILLSNLLISIQSKDRVQMNLFSEGLEKSLMFQALYELDTNNLSLQVLVLEKARDLRKLFEQIFSSDSWLNFSDEFSKLFVIKLNLNALCDNKSIDSCLVDQLTKNIFLQIEQLTYKNNLVPARNRLLSLSGITEDIGIKDYIKDLLRIIPSADSTPKENLELLAMLSSSLGAEEGKQIYLQVIERGESLVHVIKGVLLKEKSNTAPFRTGSIFGEEIFVALMAEVDKQLPTFPEEKKAAFRKVLEETIRYARTTLVGNEKSKFSFLYSKNEKGKGKKALEQDLQDSMLNFFQHSNIADGLEHEKAKFVDGGRVDIVYKKDVITIPIELKKSLSLPDRAAMELNYIAQAQTYTSGYDQVGIFVVLELSDKEKKPSPNFKDWFHIHHLPPASKMEIHYPDVIISVIIPGNRTSPSSKSTYS